MGVCVVRIVYRMLYEHARARITGGDADVRRAIVFGAGDASRRLLAGIHEQADRACRAFDDDPAKQGARIAGVPVLGPLADARTRDWRDKATHLIVAMPALAGPARRRCSSWPPTSACRC